jgi:hypothetical protein
MRQIRRILFTEEPFMNVKNLPLFRADTKRCDVLSGSIHIEGWCMGSRLGECASVRFDGKKYLIREEDYQALLRR